MRALIIDTSSVVTVAALDGPAVLASFSGTDTHRHAEDLTPAVTRVLETAGWVRPDVVVSGEGPGPFTGLRVGMATAQTLAFAWGVPVTGICSLDGLEHQVAGLPGTESGCLVALDARRKELYWAEYGPAGERLGEPQVSAVAGLPTDVPIAGAGVHARAEQIREAGLSVVEGTETMAVDAAHLGLAWVAAGSPITAPQARYLRESDAVVPASMAGVDVSKPGTRA